jgi:hypothetical protein
MEIALKQAIGVCSIFSLSSLLDDGEGDVDEWRLLWANCNITLCPLKHAKTIFLYVVIIQYQNLEYQHDP